MPLPDMLGNANDADTSTVGSDERSSLAGTNAARVVDRCWN